MWQKYRKEGVTVLGVDVGESANDDWMHLARAFQSAHHLTYPELIDPSGQTQKAYHVQAYPTNVILDRQGIVRYAGEGYDADAVKAELQRLLKGSAGSG